MSSRDGRDDDIEERLDELEDVLSELRRDLRETERGRRGPPGSPRLPSPPRPPRLSELLRFTEQYTIPTVIALLETTIKSLELLQGTLRLADPGRGVAEGAESTGDRLADVRDGATAGLSRSLAELRTALSEADLPEDAASRSIVADARDLTAEIESRIDESRRAVDAETEPPIDDESETESTTDDAVRIDVTDPDAEGGSAGRDDNGADEDTPSGPEVDVESELESIKRQMDGERDDTSDIDRGTEGTRNTGDSGAEDESGDGSDDKGESGDGREDESDTGSDAN
ncbi:DUF7547 family protein [Halorubrum laminariae]|uniref:Uncharacterized protein n=1 Tax=Halorubrum laminariae TaxID=1433523 RepID=A0ABD6BXH8_9EURY|nr:hypothetical protein [Halorubrum laminariae]